MDKFTDSNFQSARNLFIDPDAPIPSPSPVQLERATAQARLRSLSPPVGLGGAAAATPFPITGRSAAEVLPDEPHPRSLPSPGLLCECALAAE